MCLPEVSTTDMLFWGCSGLPYLLSPALPTMNQVDQREQRDIDQAGDAKAACYLEEVWIKLNIDTGFSGSARTGSRVQL